MTVLKGLKGLGDFFALDIGTTAIRVVQLTSSGPDSWYLQHYGYVPVEEKVTNNNSAEGMRKLGAMIMTAVGQSGIRRKDVVIGLPSNKTFTTVIDVPTMPIEELNSMIKYQTDQYIPMPMDETKVDWALLGQSLHDPKQQEVLLASTPIAYSEERLELVEGLGFNVLAAEPDSLAMVRSLLPPGIQDARLIIDMGENSTDLVVTYGDTPRLVRNIQTGVRSLVRVAAQNLSIQENQSRQFILKFGLAPDRLEGQVYHSIENTLDIFAIEIVKSIKFFQARYPNTPIGGILLSGFLAIIPRFGEYITAKTGINSTVANPWQKVKVDVSDQQQLGSVASEFATVIGLAQRGNS